MADEKMYSLPVSLAEAAVIRLLRSSHDFGEVTIVKANGSIRRVQAHQTYLIEDILAKYTPTENEELNAKPKDLGYTR